MKALVHGTKVLVHSELCTIRTSIKDFGTGLISYRIEETGELVNAEDVTEVHTEEKKSKFAKDLIEHEGKKDASEIMTESAQKLEQEGIEEEEVRKNKFLRTKK